MHFVKPFGYGLTVKFVLNLHKNHESVDCKLFQRFPFAWGVVSVGYGIIALWLRILDKHTRVRKCIVEYLVC